MADNYGVACYAVYLFLLTIWWGKIWDTACSCPYIHIENWLEDKISLIEVFLCTWTELMAGCCVYHVVQVLWWFEFAETHADRAFEECNTDLQVSITLNIYFFNFNVDILLKVNPYMGALIDGFATFLCRLVTRTLREKNVKFSGIIDSLISISLAIPGKF